ncbi:MAG: chemotaxis protein CheX [Terriglobia bacterium]
MSSDTGQETKDHARLVLTVRTADDVAARPKKNWSLPAGGWEALLRTAAFEILEFMLGVQVGELPESAPRNAANMTAMIGLAGELSGILSVRCPAAAAATLASRMLGAEVTPSDSDTRDALGEIANVIAGTLKAKVPGLDDACLLSTPTIVIGLDYKLFSISNSTSISVALQFEGQPLWITLDLHR